jgi:CRISPR-associated protein Cas2
MSEIITFDTDKEETEEYIDFDDIYEYGENYDKKIFVLIIYDIVNNKRRTKFAKLLQGYGFRIQKSSFEAMIPRKVYRKLLEEIPKYINYEEDSVRVYRLYGQGQIVKYGIDDSVEPEDVIII